MAQRPIYRLAVKSVHELSGHLRSFTLAGDALANFPEGFEGGYIKLMLPKPNAQPVPADLADIDRAAYTMRSYTIRSVRPAPGELDLITVKHDTAGPATRWLSAAAVGDELLVTGPGPVKMLNLDADWFLLAGDLTALPAIAVNLERLPTGARGYAVIQVDSQADILELSAPDNLETVWVTTGAQSQSEINQTLADTVRSLAWLPGRASVWAASEFGAAKQLRTYFRDERAVQADDLYVSSYWKCGATDEEHKAAKKSLGS